MSSCKKVTDYDIAPEPSLHLSIAPEGMQMLGANREAAIRDGVLLSDNNDWVDAILQTPDTTLFCSVRLKGDWVDHLQGDKWSFRIKLGSDEAWKGMRVFSVQDPVTRDHLSEYVYHKWLMAEDILTTRYFFMPFTLNDGKTYTYAVEEHFDINLIESQHRRAGPIMRFSEDFLWSLRVMDSAAFASKAMYEKNIDAFAIAEISSFSDKGLGKDAELTKQFEVARTLMQQYREGLIPLSDIFDMDKMAKYFAIIDVNQAYHSLIWHNMRFYFNPITQKLEPIGFDGFTEYGVYDDIHRPFIGYTASAINRKKINDDLLVTRFFNDFTFADSYAKYLKKYSDSTYIQSLIAGLQEEIGDYSDLISNDYPGYAYSPSRLYDRAKAIRANLEPNGDYTLRAFESMQEPGNIECVNHIALPVQILGMSIRPDTIMYYYPEPLSLISWNEFHAPPAVQVPRIGEGAYMFYKVAGIDTMLTTKIWPWEDRMVVTPEQTLFRNEVVTNDVMVVKKDEIYFRNGKHIITKPIIIPDGYKVFISPGTQLDLKNGAMIISRSPVEAIGTEDAPISIISSDSSSMGFTVLQANTPSTISYVIFDHLSPLQYQGWELMGAVNFFESEVYIDHSRFTHSKSEDALNIMRSEFKMERNYFAFTDGDAFDSDFCTGEIIACSFSNTRNDAMDFSGSNVKVRDCRMVDLGDKGVSCGEDSQISISGGSIVNARLGIAAKDLSHVDVTDMQMTDCGIGYLAFVKKKAFGRSYIVVQGGSLTNVKQQSSALDGCTVKFK